MNDLLNYCSAADLNSLIRCSVSNNHPFSLDRLYRSLANERASTGARSTIIKLLEREIRRQEKIVAKLASFSAATVA
jgi:hypothetical protein